MNLKAFAFLLFGLLTIACDRKPIRESPQRQAIDPLVARMMAQDSGFITKKEGLAWLLKSGLIDSSEAECQHYRRTLSATDTIGKFYRMPSSSHLLIYCSTMHHCGDQMGEYVLCTLTRDCQIYQREFDTNSIRTCGGRYLNSFRRVGSFFVIPGSYDYGTGFCRSDINCFDRLPAGADGSIVSNLILSGTNLIRGDYYATLSLKSAISFAHDTLLMHYQQRKVMRGLDDERVVSDSSQRFVVQFIRSRNGWQALDSTRYRRFCEEM